MLLRECVVRSRHGVISYEFLYGIPPFHAETPEEVIENVLSGHID